jgi:hypothetical protein
MSGIPGNLGHITPHTATLGTQFGDAPLGRVGDHQLSATNPGNPRAMAPTTGDKVKAFFERALNALTPKSVRADSKLQEATKALSRHLGDALGGLSGKKTPENMAATKTALIKLTADAAEMVKRGVPFDQALSSRIGVHLSQLGADELSAIVQGARGKDGVALLGELSAEGHQEAVTAFGKIVTEATRLAEAKFTQAAANKVDTILQKALNEVDTPLRTGGGNRFLDVYAEAEGPGLKLSDQLRNELGATLTGADAASYQLGMAKDGMARMQPNDLAKLLTRVPTQDLANLLQAQSKTGADVSGVDVAIRREVALRTDRLASEVGVGMHEVHEEYANGSSGAPQSMSKVAEGIIKGGEAVAALAKHAAAHGTGTADQVANESLNFLKMAIKDGFSQRDINAQLSDLAPQQLVRLSKALDSLGMSAEKAFVDLEITNRKEEADAKFQLAANAFGAAVMGGTPSDIVGALKHLNDEIETLALDHQKLGAKVADLGDRKDFIAKATDIAVGSLPDLTQSAIKSYVSLPETQQMVFAFMQMGAEIQVTSPQIGRALTNVGEKLDMIAASVKAPLPALEGDKTASERLDANARAVLKSQFGIFLDGEHPVAEGKGVSPANQTRTETAFAERLASQPSPLNKAVDASFAIDVPRMQISILGKPIGNTLTGAVIAMQNFASSPQELMAITGVVNQTSAIPLANGLFRNLSGESAFSFADGTQFKPLSGGDGRSTMSFDVWRNEQGEPVVRVNVTYDEMTAVQRVPDGARIPLPGGTVTMSMDVTIRADGTSEITSKPVTSMHISEFGRMLRDPSLAHEKTAFENDLKRQFSEENLGFWDSVQSHKANPSVSSARALMGQFIGDSAQSQINIDGNTAQDLANTMSKIQNGTATPDDIKNMFDTAQQKIEHLMENDSYPKFLKTKAS